MLNNYINLEKLYECIEEYNDCITATMLQADPTEKTPKLLEEK